MQIKPTASAISNLYSSLPSRLMAALALVVATSANAQTSTIDNSTAWNGTDMVSAWGVPNTATFGQTITPGSNQTNLQSFTVNMSQLSGVAANYQAYVYAWDAANSRITGNALYTSGVLTAPTGTGFTPVTINTGGVALKSGQQYVVFLTTSSVPGQEAARYAWGRMPGTSYTGGQLVLSNNGSDFGSLANNLWNATNYDTAFLAKFGPNEVVTPPANNPYVLCAVISVKNLGATNAAIVIDAHLNLQALFSALSSALAISNATTQTQPLVKINSTSSSFGVLLGITNLIRARIDIKRGMASGDDFMGNKNVWMKPFGSWADQGDRNSVSGYKSSTYGLAMGVDGDVTSNLSLGGAIAYAKSDINGNSSAAPQSSDVDIYQLIGYGTYHLGNRTDIDFQADIGQNTNKGSRQIAFTSTTALSDYKSNTAHVGAALGRTFNLTGQTTVTPSVRVDYTRIKDQAFSETGAGVLNLNVASHTTEALVVGIDGKVAHQLNDQTTLTANLGVGYDTISKQNAITSAFAGAPDAAFVTYGIDPSPWMTRAGIGAIYKTKTGLELTARYDAESRQDFINQTASVKARWAF